jgi:Do/DeqQ family serine protease
MLLCVLAIVLAATSFVPLTSQATLPWETGNGTVPSLAPLLKELTPGVVNIAVLSRATVNRNPLLNDPFFRRFFNIPEGAPRSRPRVSAGSGVIVDARRGYVMTNHHVIANAAEIAVTLKDRRRFEAEFIGSDPATDIALLRIQARDLKTVPFGDSEAMKVGDFVLAIGNPFGLGQTVTSGIVSALGRNGLRVEGYEDFIQTDASINPGNSGGALVNLRGELIGINTAIVAPSGGNVGIGFAVPSNMAKAVMDQLINFGQVRRGRIGVSVQDLTPDIADALGLDNADGALITQVDRGSPAARAGLRQRDIVTEVNGERIDGSTDLRNKVGLVPVGKSVEMLVIRRGRARRVTVRVGS